MRVEAHAVKHALHNGPDAQSSRSVGSACERYSFTAPVIDET